DQPAHGTQPCARHLQHPQRPFTSRAAGAGPEALTMAGAPAAAGPAAAIACFPFRRTKRRTTKTPSVRTSSAARTGTMIARTDRIKEIASSSVDTTQFASPPVVAVEAPRTRTVAD